MATALYPCRQGGGAAAPAQRVDFPSLEQRQVPHPGVRDTVRDTVRGLGGGVGEALRGAAFRPAGARLQE
ncbi:MAG: hypothetical protein ACKV2O_00340 [Acidimicrobiales bacterium]